MPIPIWQKRLGLAGGRFPLRFASEILASSPKYCWPMNDASSPCLPLVGGVNLNITNGSFQEDGDAVLFNGVNACGVTAAILILSGTQMVTVESIVSVVSQIGAADIHHELSTSSSVGSNAFGCYRTATHLETVIKGDVGYQVGQWPLQSSGYHHRVIIYDKTQAVYEISTYLDGILQSAISYPNTANNTNNFGDYPMYLAARACTSTWANIKTKWFTVYDRALTPTEILKHAKAAGF